MTKAKLALATIVAALACAVPASADSPQDYFPNACGRPATGIWDSYVTGHSWVGLWTGTDVARGAPSDGVWRLYAAAYKALGVPIGQVRGCAKRGV